APAGVSAKCHLDLLACGPPCPVAAIRDGSLDAVVLSLAAGGDEIVERGVDFECQWCVCRKKRWRRWTDRADRQYDREGGSHEQSGRDAHILARSKSVARSRAQPLIFSGALFARCG